MGKFTFDSLRPALGTMFRCAPAAVEGGMEEGKRLLAADFAATSQLGISSSLSFILDGNRLAAGLGELAKLPGFEKITLPPQSSGAACNK